MLTRSLKPALELEIIDNHLSSSIDPVKGMAPNRQHVIIWVDTFYYKYIQVKWHRYKA